MLLNRRFTSAAQGVTLIVKCSLVLQLGNGPKLRATDCWNSTNPLDYFVLAQQGRVEGAFEAYLIIRERKGKGATFLSNK